MRILIADDHEVVRRGLKQMLADEFPKAAFGDAQNSQQVLDAIWSHTWDIVLLDINMPGMGGLAACRAIRADPNVAIVMLTVHNSEAAKVEALDAGADDFVTKPFSTPELLARIRAALRRVPATQAAPNQLRVGPLAIDFAARTVSQGEATSHLTPKELDLLRYLTQHANQAVSHRELLQTVWGPDYGDQVDYLRAFIKNLRKKVEINPDRPQYITTEPWVGYRFNGTPESS